MRNIWAIRRPCVKRAAKPRFVSRKARPSRGFTIP